MRIFFLSLFFISNLCLVGCNKATQQLSEKSAIPSQNQIDSNKLVTMIRKRGQIERRTSQ
jgi:hypothetical protein